MCTATSVVKGTRTSQQLPNRNAAGWRPSTSRSLDQRAPRQAATRRSRRPTGRGPGAPTSSSRNSSIAMSAAPTRPDRSGASLTVISSAAGGQRHGAPVDRLPDAGEQRGPGLRHAAGHDDAVRVEEVDQGGEHRADGPAGVADQLQGRRRRPGRPARPPRAWCSPAARPRRRRGAARRRRRSPRGSSRCRTGRPPCRPSGWAT